MRQLIECVPNFSEGRNMDIIKQITDEIESVDGIKLLDVDPGAATNRTVVTFVGEPKPVMDAAIKGMKKAKELIDMSKHSGAHPRFGATDVCPLVPVANISMEETIAYAHQLAERAGKELNYPIYCYEFAAKSPERKNLAYVRSGEYEALKKKLQDKEWTPDYGPATFVPEAGATAISARNFLVAFNVNLNTTSTRRANAIAFDVRERGRVKREGHPITGKAVLDQNGKKVMTPGSLKSVKAIGWFIEEYGIAQISMNLTDISVTSVHKAYDDVFEKALARGIRVSGSELVGVIPLEAMLEAGRYFLIKQNRSLGVSNQELIKIAVKSMGLDDLKPFDPRKNIIEYLLEDENDTKLIDLNLSEFADETASESPAPGGGSISAYVGALGISLGTMVANLSAHKAGVKWEDQCDKFSEQAVKGQKLKDQLVHLVDEDTNAFNKIMDAIRLPKASDEEKKARIQAIEDASKYAIEVPFMVMQKSLESMQVIKAMAEYGNPNSVSDAGVGALCARTAVMGAFLNVKINAADLEDKEYVEKMLNHGAEIEAEANALEQEILKITNDKING
ncbi:MAG: glutamate formimidoyltransferase [Bacteroidetes bacterium 4572_77]|nr:MAG: glutamate formimidoyltransferase [Bacteroidetes bacterium 4572_77]